jgi:hypothetical protein
VAHIDLRDPERYISISISISSQASCPLGRARSDYARRVWEQEDARVYGLRDEGKQLGVEA